MKYIYLDWNVMQYSKQLKKDGNVDEASFYGLVRKISKKYHFPFSIAHLKDLAASKKDENNTYIEEDLLFISSFTNNYAITMENSNSQKLKIIKTTNVNKEFEGVQKLMENSKNIQPDIVVSGDSYEIDMGQVKKDDLLNELLEKNNGILEPKLVIEFIKYISKELSDPKFYKKFRKQVSELKSKYRKSHKSIVDKKSDYFKNFIPVLDFFLEKDSDKILSTFPDVLEAFLSINGRKKEDLDKYQKIELAYMLLDFNPKFHDIVTKDNRPSNIQNDIEHLYFASEAKYYVTEDKCTFKKSTIVSNFLFPQLKIVTMSEFQQKFC